MRISQERLSGNALHLIRISTIPTLLPLREMYQAGGPEALPKAGNGDI